MAASRRCTAPTSSAVAFASAGSGLHHKICHVLGGMFDLPHAETHAVVLPYVLALNAPAVPDLDARMAAAFGSHTALGRPAAAAGARSSAPRSLRDLGLAEADLERAVGPILEAAPPSNPVPVTAEEIEALLHAAYDGSGPGMSDLSPEQQAREADLVERVVASFAGTPDPRTRELVEALTRHLHAFLRETRLTEDEWWRAIEFLTAVGHLTDDRRQEFILLSDVLGASMQTITINNEAYANATEATVFGPFFVEGSPDVGLGGDISGDAAGEPCWVEGTVLTPSGSRRRCAGRGLGGRRRRAVRRAVRRRPGRRGAGISTPMPTAATASGRSPPRRTRSPTTVPSASCCGPPAAPRCAPPTST